MTPLVAGESPAGRRGRHIKKKENPPQMIDFTICNKDLYAWNGVQ